MAEAALDIPDPRADMEVGCVKSHFLDSGAFSLWTLAAKYAAKHKKDGRWGYYETPEFWQYMDAYAAFIKKYQYGIDFYANMDVIPNPELSWRNLKYLEEKHGLSPVPVVHYRTDLKWLKKYMDAGYDFIGLGGLVGSTGQDHCVGWIDRCFDMVCDAPNRLPKIKLHGFGVTSHDLLWRYPWYSVDSASWTKVAAYGNILVPHKRAGAFTFRPRPYVISVSDLSPSIKRAGRHYRTLARAERRIVQEWLDSIGVPFGKSDKDGNILEYGVSTRHTERRAATLYFFEQLRESLPKYPWEFRSTRRKGLGLV